MPPLAAKKKIGLSYLAFKPLLFESKITFHKNAVVHCLFYHSVFMKNLLVRDRKVELSTDGAWKLAEKWTSELDGAGVEGEKIGHRTKVLSYLAEIRTFYQINTNE